MLNPEELQIDTTAEGARALHRVVRAMHDGHCPKCGYLGPSSEFEKHYARAPGNLAILDHKCPSCCFRVTHEESKAALEAFRPHFLKSVEVFEEWRAGQKV